MSNFSLHFLPVGNGSAGSRISAPVVGAENRRGRVALLVSKIDRVKLGMRCSTSARYAGKRGLFISLAAKPTCFQRRSRNDRSLAPLGARVACNRRFHQPGQDG